MKHTQIKVGQDYSRFGLLLTLQTRLSLESTFFRKEYAYYRRISAFYMINKYGKHPVSDGGTWYPQTVKFIIRLNR